MISPQEVANYPLTPTARVRVLRDHHTPPRHYLLSYEYLETWHNYRGDIMQTWEVNRDQAFEQLQDTAGHYPIPGLATCLEALDIAFDVEPGGDR